MAALGKVGNDVMCKAIIGRTRGFWLLSFVLGSIFAVAAGSPRTQAATVTYVFTGSIDTATTYSNKNLLATDQIQGTFTYDTSEITPESMGSAPSTFTILYNYGGQTDQNVSFSFTIGGYTGAPSNNPYFPGVVVGDDESAIPPAHGSDFFKVQGYTSSNDIGGVHIDSFSLVLEDTDGAVFSSGALPLVLPALASFESATITMNFAGASGTLGINITSLSLVSAVPLPAALPLFASGIAALGFLGRRRKKRMAKAAAQP